MKKRHHIISVFLSISLVLSFSVTAAANDTTVPSHNVAELEGIHVEELAPVDLSNVQSSNIISISQQIDLPENDSEFANAIVNTTETPNINTALLEEAMSLPKARTRSTPSYQMHTMSGLLTAAKPDALYTIYVEAGQILQAELLVPQNLTLNYDLYLFEYVEATSAITLVSGSEYITDSSFMPESAGAINNSGGRMTYLIMITSNNNPSPTDYYTLNASTSNTHDSFEPNENILFATELPEINSTAMLTLSGSLNSPLDNDWFSLYVADTSEFSGLELQGVPASAVIESYTVRNGNQLTKTGSTESGVILPISTGYNYFRLVATRNTAFTPGIYTIRVSPALNATKAVFFIAVNGYCQRTSSLFNDGRNRRLLLSGADVEVRVIYATDNNIPVKATDTVTVTIFNPAWDSPLMQYETGIESAQNSYTCTVFMDAPIMRGSRYDLVFATITSQKLGVLADAWEMALMFQYGNQETSSPCIHNGACGFN